MFKTFVTYCNKRRNIGQLLIITTADRITSGFNTYILEYYCLCVWLNIYRRFEIWLYYDNLQRRWPLHQRRPRNLEHSATLLYVPLICHCCTCLWSPTAVRASDLPQLYVPLISHCCMCLWSPTAVRASDLPQLYMPLISHCCLTLDRHESVTLCRGQ
jgi:hypothetical protein